MKNTTAKPSAKNVDTILSSCPIGKLLCIGGFAEASASRKNPVTWLSWQKYFYYTIVSSLSSCTLEKKWPDMPRHIEPSFPSVGHAIKFPLQTQLKVQVKFHLPSRRLTFDLYLPCLDNHQS